MTGERPLVDAGDGAFLPIDLEPEFAFEEGGDRGHHPFSRHLRCHVDVAIAGVVPEARFAATRHKR